MLATVGHLSLRVVINKITQCNRNYKNDLEKHTLFIIFINIIKKSRLLFSFCWYFIIVFYNGNSKYLFTLLFVSYRFRAQLKSFYESWTWSVMSFFSISNEMLLLLMFIKFFLLWLLPFLSFWVKMNSPISSIGQWVPQFLYLHWAFKW